MNENSILKNIIYLDVKFNKEESDIDYIEAIKYFEDSIFNFKCNCKEENFFKSFLQFKGDLPIIIWEDSSEKVHKIKSILGISNILNLIELIAILEPWQKEYTLDYILNETVKDEFISKSDSNVIKMIKVTNSILSRQWHRDEKSSRKKNLYQILVQNYNLLDKWQWTRYIEKPLFYNYDDVNYVEYKKKKDNTTVTYDNIDYNKYEDLLKDSNIWADEKSYKYEYRESQKNFSKAIRLNIENDSKIFIEAPTGSGKTFAYVLIAVLKAHLNRKGREDGSFIISTDTKELQNQLIERDIPNIIKKLNLKGKITYGDMKGKSNYICTEKLVKNIELRQTLEGIFVDIYLKRLCKDGQYGDIEKINYWAYNYFNIGKYIDNVVCDKDDCNLDRCKKICYLKNRYNQIGDEHITVINHSLLANWPYKEKRKITHLIIDEAHNLMEKCYDYFSEEFNSIEFRKLLDHVLKTEPTIFKQLLRLNMSNGYRADVSLEKIKYWVDEIEINLAIILNSFMESKICKEEYSFKTEFYLDNDGKTDFYSNTAVLISKLKESIYGLYSLIKGYFNDITLDGEEGSEDFEYTKIAQFYMHLKEVFDVLDMFLSSQEEFKDYAKILEVSNDYSFFTFKNVPLDIDKIFNENVLKDVKSTTFLSATMQVNNSFNRIKNTLGQKEANELVVPPTFNLKYQTKVFILNDLGSYNSNIFVDRSANFIYNIAKKLKGHTLVLFTSNTRKRLVEQKLLEFIKGTKLEVHTSKKAIKYLNDFNKEVIILGSKGFFEGIDVPGESLTCVILDKLPNKSLSDPLLKAKTIYKKMKYVDVNYPQACISVKQAYGRLIRSKSDYGYFCVLDGGKNINTINKLESDLLGPKFETCSSSHILKRIDADFYNWKKK